MQIYNPNESQQTSDDALLDLVRQAKLRGAAARGDPVPPELISPAQSLGSQAVPTAVSNPVGPPITAAGPAPSRASDDDLLNLVAQAKKQSAQQPTEQRAWYDRPAAPWAGPIMKTISNIPGSFANTIGGYVKAASDPVGTVSSILGPIMSNMSLSGQQVPGSYQHDIAQPQASAMGGYFKNRYGGLTNIANTIQEDPVGVASDVAAALDTGGGLLRGTAAATDATARGAAWLGAARTAKVARGTAGLLDTTGRAIQTAADYTNPASLLRIPGKVVKGGVTITRSPNPVRQAAVDYMIQNAPPETLDLATATGNSYARGLKQILPHLPWSGAEDKANAQVQAVSDFLKGTGNQMAPGAATDVASAGAFTTKAIEDRMKVLTDQTTTLRDAIRQRAAANPGLMNGPVGPVPVEAPFYTYYPQTVAAPELAKLVAAKANPALIAQLQHIMDQKGMIPMEIADAIQQNLDNLAKKKIPGEGLTTTEGRVAIKVQRAMKDAMQWAADDVSPQSGLDYAQSNLLTERKHDIAEDIPTALRDSPDIGLVAKRVLEPDDAGLTVLQRIQNETPGMIPHLRGALIDQLIDPIVRGGAVDAVKSSINRLEKLGPETQRILFPKQDDLAALKNRLQYAYQLKPPNTSGTAPVMTAIALTKGLLSNPVESAGAILGARRLTKIMFDPDLSAKAAAGLPIGPTAGPVTRAVGAVVNPRTINLAAKNRQIQTGGGLLDLPPRGAAPQQQAAPQKRSLLMGPPTAALMPGGEYAKPGPYKTALTGGDEAKFQAWVRNNKIPWEDTPTADYDMRGYWQAQQQGDPAAKQADNLHFPDTWKTPWHQSFSNESMYAKPNAPHWVGDKLYDSKGKLLVDETGQ